MAKKKWKKRIKKALKGAAIAGGALLAAKALKGRGASSPFLASGAAGGARLPKGDAFARARKAMTHDRAYGNYHDPIMTGGSGVQYDSPPGIRVTDPHEFRYPMNLKKGGRVTGIAKRGFGRALKKGRK